MLAVFVVSAYAVHFLFTDGSAIAIALLLGLQIVLILKSTRWLRQHNINIKEYPLEQVQIESVGDQQIRLTINSPRSLSKEIENYYYVFKPKEWQSSLQLPVAVLQESLYHDVRLEKTPTGTRIVYLLKKIG
jgi:hypothetical protein